MNHDNDDLEDLEAKLIAWLEELQAERNVEKPIEPEPDYELEQVCERCGSQIMYRPQWDAEYCPTCNRWLRPPCSDSTCIFCAHRPEKPFMT